MPDDKNNPGARDGQRINVHDDHEVRYWTDKFEITSHKLKDTVSEVGPMVDDVKRALGK